MEKLKPFRLFFTWFFTTCILIGICILILWGLVELYKKMYSNRIYPGITIAHIHLDGLTKDDARKVVSEKIESIITKGFTFTFHDRAIVLDATTVSTDPDASRDIIKYDIDTAIDRAYSVGRGNDQIQNVYDIILARTYAVHITPTSTIDREWMKGALESVLKKDLVSVQDAELEIRASDPPKISIKPERAGIVLISDPALNEFEKQAQSLEFKPIALSERRILPNIKSEDIKSVKEDVVKFLERPLPHFIYGEKTISLTTSIFAGWVAVTNTNGGWNVIVDPVAFGKGLHSLALKDGLEIEGKNGNLVVKDKKIISFVPGLEGREVNTNAAFEDFSLNWPATTTFVLEVHKTRGTLAGTDPERLGIRELLGTGKSNFSGSPKNRRLNIAHGVKQVNGTIVGPGEEFSMIKTLGTIDEVNGWLPELVIKGNATEPEFGGGLCQIGTTAFRGAMSSGLPIVERQNHSYRVRYYEPAGTDATIYYPKPDFRFRNDTLASILISARIVKEDVIFDFWGSSDGRSASTSASKISDIVEPPPMKLIETLELPPGKKKCTETAHAGANAEFTYSVLYPNGDDKKMVFHSHYRPWQAVCLVGVLKLTGDATTTNDL